MKHILKGVVSIPKEKQADIDTPLAFIVFYFFLISHLTEDWNLKLFSFAHLRCVCKYRWFQNINIKKYLLIHEYPLLHIDTLTLQQYDAVYVRNTPDHLVRFSPDIY